MIKMSNCCEKGTKCAGECHETTIVKQAANITLDKLLRPITDKDIKEKKTHIVCTMGPACGNVDTIVQMIDAGMNICRFNFSHGDFETHGKMLSIVREAIAMRPECNIGILLDTKGPEIRSGFLVNHEPIRLERGNILKITTDYSYLGNSTCISCSYPKLSESVKVGSIILMADGSISCEVVSVGQGEVYVKLLNSAILGERKNMNLPGIQVDLPILSEKDKNDLLMFCIPNAMHFIALSFTQSAEDIKETRRILGEAGKNIKLIPKIENVQGMINYDEIVDAADGIMIARGDLGMEIPLEKVCLAQKYMIKRAKMKSKPVITATQMLESMCSNPRPTRAEVADVINAVLDGTDCVMLSGESAGGKYPVECVSYMAKLCFEAENCMSHGPALLDDLSISTEVSFFENAARSAVLLAVDSGASLIVCTSGCGALARYLSKHRPPCLILSVTNNETCANYLTALRGVISLLVKDFLDLEKAILDAIEVAKTRKYIKSGDDVVAVYGDYKNNKPGSANIRLLRI